MPRIRLLGIALAFSLALGCVVLLTAHGVCADPPTGKKEPPKPLAELAKDLRDPDLKKRLAAAEAIRDHYKGKTLEALPQILAALGDVLDHLRDEPTAEQSVLNRTEAALRQAAYGAGPGRMKVIKEFTRHSDPRVRAAAFRAWLKPVNKQANIAEDRDDLLVAIRRGLKDDSPLVRAQAAHALAGFWDAPLEMAGKAMSLLIATLDDQAKHREGAFSPAFEAACWLMWFEAKQAKSAIPALVKAVAADDVRLACMSMMALNTIAKADESVAENAVRVLRSVLTNKRRPELVREYAIRRLIGIGPTARWAIPDLIDLLDDPMTSSDLQRAAINAFEDMGPRAAPAVPTLVRLLERSAERWEQLRLAPAHRAVGSAVLWLDGWNRWRKEVEKMEQEQKRSHGYLGIVGRVPFDVWMRWELQNDLGGILRALKAIGPAAAPAIESLKRYREKIQDWALDKLAYDALVAIEK